MYFKSLFLLSILHFLLLKKTTLQSYSCSTADVSITSTGSFCLYISGNKVGCGNDSSFNHRITLLKHGDAIVIRAKNEGNEFQNSGIYGFFGDQVTNHNWKCMPSEDDYMSDWLLNNFDDGNWPYARIVQNNSDQFMYRSSSEMIENPKWIWSESILSSNIYCRLTFKPLCSKYSKI
jgi:hypothetical protein